MNEIFCSYQKRRKVNEQLRNEESPLRQKSRVNLLPSSDLNMKFYYLSTTIRRRRNEIDSIKIEPGNWTMDQNIIESTFINCFRTIFSSSHKEVPEVLENLFEKQILDQDNEHLTALTTEEEIYGALKQIPNHKALGLNKMMSLFYKHFWKIIKREVIVPVPNSFCPRSQYQRKFYYCS